MDFQVMQPISFARRAAHVLVMAVCLLLILHVYGIEAFVVPTGSMAPALAGHHRAANCPCCGFHLLVGRHGSADDDQARYPISTCPNCGSAVSLEDVPEAMGDHILVNKSAFLIRRPRRWEIIVFRLFGKIFVKRVIGLPGEWLEIVDGDIYIDGLPARKTLNEFKQVRMLLYAGECHAGLKDWKSRWALGESGGFRWMTYRNFSLQDRKVSPILDEYPYNAGSPQGEEAVHDFMIECDLEIRKGTGRVALEISDGRDVLMARLPVGSEEMMQVCRIAGKTMPASPAGSQTLAQADYGLQAKGTYHLELAFVDRRLSLAVDGKEVLAPVDLPPAADRPGVLEPVSLGIEGIDASFRNVRLYRDVHYTQAGKQGGQGKPVLLQGDQYFVLGDNSPNSEDSRFWPNRGAVPENSLLGKPFLVHLPNRVVSRSCFGREWQFQLPDWNRVRWLH